MTGIDLPSNLQEALRKIRSTVNSDTRVDHEWLVRTSDTRPKPKCISTGETSKPSLPDPSEFKMTEPEARKLLNYMIVYTMMDTRYIIPDLAILDIQNDPTLLSLIRKNWLGFDGIFGVLKNIFEQKKPEYGGYFGDFKLENDEFLDMIKERLLNSTILKLMVFDEGNESLSQEIAIIQRQLELLSRIWVLRMRPFELEFYGFKKL